MSIALTTDILLKSVGKRVKNDQDELLGEIVEITRNPKVNHIEYAILKCGKPLEASNRYFAIPVSSALVKITEGGKIIILSSKDELQQSNRITRGQCPSPDFNSRPSIFELFDYEGPELSKSMNKTSE